MLKEVREILSKMQEVVSITERFNELVIEIDAVIDTIYESVWKTVRDNKIDNHVLTVDVNTLNGIFKAIILKVRDSETNEETTYSFTVNGMAIEDDAQADLTENCIIVKNFDTGDAEVVNLEEISTDTNPDVASLLKLVYDQIHYTEE